MNINNEMIGFMTWFEDDNFPYLHHPTPPNPSFRIGHEMWFTESYRVIITAPSYLDTTVPVTNVRITWSPNMKHTGMS